MSKFLTLVAFAMARLPSFLALTAFISTFPAPSISYAKIAGPGVPSMPHRH
jgi:hypothetical protein